MKQVSLYTKIIFQIFLYLLETIGVSILLTVITNNYIKVNNTFEIIERITVFYTLYQIIIYNILQQLNDIKKDEYLAILSMYKYVEIYNFDKRESIKKEINNLIVEELNCETLNDNDIRREHLEIKGVLDNNLSFDKTTLKIKILKYEHLCEETVLNWKYSLLLRIFKNGRKRK